MMKKLLLAALCWASVVGVQAEDYPYLVFTRTDGSTVTLPVQSLCIKFSNGNLVATTSSLAVQTLPLDGLQSMAFSLDAGDPSAVQGVPQDADAAPVRVFTVNGIHVGDYDSAAQALRTLPKGIYIIKQEQDTYLKAVQ